MSEESGAVHHIVLLRVCNHIFVRYHHHFYHFITFFDYITFCTRREHVNRYYNGHRTRSQSGGQTKSQRVVALVHETVVDVHLSLIRIYHYYCFVSDPKFQIQTI